MPRRCQISGCEGGGKNIEAWRIKEFVHPVVVWLCDYHHEQSLAASDLLLNDGSDGT